ncbi:TPA: class I SAM-dependent methyltransferase [Candidatus Woesearchaeota archaeon]|nr:class I SAM-dependent methyltransferase [Candidatus Woesearchaeota archaeon]HII68359.1 class I SAM-dependent methyltransferase [Candidatus Woesearchaeota archaeon]
MNHLKGIKGDKEFEHSVKAAYKEFAEEPMDENYRHPVIGLISGGRVRRLLREAGNLKGKSLLEVGCEAGYVSIQFKKKGATVTAFDVCEPALERFRQKKESAGITIFAAAAQKIPLKDNSFDVVVCTEVIEHMPKVEQCIGEMARVLKQGGKLYITFPNEKLRKPFYPLAQAMGINTSIEDEVTLYDYKFSYILSLCRKHLRVEKKFSWPFFLPLTRFIVAKKEAMTVITAPS